MTDISVVLPAYKTKFLRQAIDSILNQTYPDFELIIVDDASPENIEKIISSYDDNRIRYYRNEQNIGRSNLVKQWNHSIAYAKGEYIVLAADDDVYDPNFFQECIRLAKKYPQVDLVRSRVKLINELNNLTGIDGLIPEFCSPYQYLYYWMNATILTCIGNYMFKADVLKRKQFIEFPSAFCSDAASTIMLSENGVATTTEMLFSFRFSSIHLSSDKTRLEDKLEANNLFYRWLLALNYPTPSNEIDRFCSESFRRNAILEKCTYDYYNQIYKYLPISKLMWVNRFELASPRNKITMVIRYFFSKIIGKL